MAVAYAIDMLAMFKGRLSLAGWVLGPESIAELAFEAPGVPQGRHVIRSYGRIDSADVQAAYGDVGVGARFAEAINVDPAAFSIRATSIVVRFKDGHVETIHDPGAPINQSAHKLHERFWTLVGQVAQGQVLEVGSRARSGITRREMVPKGWDYTGLDVIDGPNVDIVGDAHELTSLFPKQRFDAVFAFSVLEHLLMPWKFVAELNRVLQVGAVGLFTTHQCWPMHDQPWDFWRFSDQAWNALFNKATGFEIIDAQMGEPAYVVAQRLHAVTNFADHPAGFLASNVLFRKTADSHLHWPVRVADIISSSYPGGEISSPLL